MSRKYADGYGRARRTEYWAFVLFSLIAILSPAAIGMGLLGLAEAMNENLAIYVVGGLFLFIAVIASLGLLIPSITVRIRRFHDVGLSGWLILLNAIPYAGALIVFVITVLPSQKSTNVHGAVPGQAPGQSLEAVFD